LFEATRSTTRTFTLFKYIEEGKHAKIIVLALAAFRSPAFADTANVNIYGAVNMSVESINNGDSAAGARFGHE
jgi:hypothetical protein